MLDQIDHVGVAVEDMDAALTLYTGPLAMPLQHRETVEAQGVDAELYDRTIDLRRIARGNCG